MNNMHCFKCNDDDGLLNRTNKLCRVQSFEHELSSIMII